VVIWVVDSLIGHAEAASRCGERRPFFVVARGFESATSGAAVYHHRLDEEERVAKVDWRVQWQGERVVVEV
jgi:hypothetical protein